MLYIHVKIIYNFRYKTEYVILTQWSTTLQLIIDNNLGHLSNVSFYEHYPGLNNVQLNQLLADKLHPEKEGGPDMLFLCQSRSRARQ